MLTAITGLLGVVIPPAFKLIRNMWGRKQDDPEEMIGVLAEDKPEALPEYLKGLAALYEAKKNYFNRDVIDGDVWKWVKSFRALIRPTGVVVSFVVLILHYNGYIVVDEASKATMAGWIGTWMGDRIDV